MWVTGEYFDSFRDAEVAARGRLDRSAQADPFARLEWFARLWDHDPPGRTPLIVRARAGAAEAWLFLARTARRDLIALAAPETSRFGPIFSGEPDQALRRALLGAIGRRLRMLGMARIGLGPLLAEDASLIGQAFGGRTGWKVSMHGAPANFRLSVAGRSFEDYWDSCSDRLHEQAATGLRDVHVEITDRVTAPLWEELRLVGEVTALIRATALADDPRGALRLGLARVGDAPVAAQLWSVETESALCLWRSEDPDAHHLAPSVQLTASMLRYLINVDHVRSIDLGNGQDEELGDWADERRPLRRLELFNRSAPSAWMPALGASATALVRRPPLD